jgi:hypothetical protein
MSITFGEETCKNLCRHDDIQVEQESYGSYGPSELIDTINGRRDHLLKEFRFYCIVCSMCVAVDTEMRIRESVSAATYMEHTQMRPFVARGEHVETMDATIEKVFGLADRAKYWTRRMSDRWRSWD